MWHATHLGLDIPCAVKFIEGSIALVPEAIARFEREAKSAAQLRSPNVVQILDHGLSDGTPYIAMELLDGEDLGKRLLRVPRLSPRHVVNIASDICRALTKAHGCNVVHRDLKPDNIFLVRDDDREFAKVLDFGVAKAAHPGVHGATTKAGAVLGTPFYMSPEQARGASSADARSDLWSLAVIVYRCLTGRLPFESDSIGELLLQILVKPLPVPSAVAPDLPRRFDHFWARATERDPDRRFQTAKEFSVALALAFGLSPAAGKRTGGTVEMPMTDDGTAPRPPGAPPPAARPAFAQPAPAPQQQIGHGHGHGHDVMAVAAVRARRFPLLLMVLIPLIAIGVVVAVVALKLAG